jgi:hypothetical protein
MVVKTEQGPTGMKIFDTDIKSHAVSRPGDTEPRLYLSLACEPTPFNKSTKAMMKDTANSNVKKYSNFVFTFPSSDGLASWEVWRSRWASPCGNLAAPSELRSSAGAQFDHRKQFDHATVSTHRSSQVATKAKKKDVPLLDMADEETNRFVTRVEEVDYGFYCGTSSVRLHCTFCRQAVFLKHSLPMPLWCLLSSPAEVHGKCTQRDTWGGVAVEDGGLDDEEVAEDFDDDYGNDREGRRADLQTGRFGDGE